MDKVQIIITVASSFAVLLGALGGFIVSLVKAIKAKTFEVNKFSIVQQIKEIALKSKDLVEMTDEQRVQYVYDEVGKFVKLNNLTFEGEAVKDALEDIVKFFYHLKPPTDKK